MMNRLMVIGRLSCGKSLRRILIIFAVWCALLLLPAAARAGSAPIPKPNGMELFFPYKNGAPEIRLLPDFVIGDAEGPDNCFVYPDAIDLTQYATDDTTNTGIRWSYFMLGTPRYRINNVDVITLSNSAINSPGAKRIDTSLDPADLDGDPKTITLREIATTPISGTGTPPATAGESGEVVVTLFASDGTTYSSRNIKICINNGGADQLRWPPHPEIKAAPTAVDFGEQDISAGPAVKIVTISNTGDQDLMFSGAGIYVSGSSSFSVTNHPTKTPLAPGATREVWVAFDPTYASTPPQTDSGWLFCSTNDPSYPSFSVPLTGKAVNRFAVSGTAAIPAGDSPAQSLGSTGAQVQFLTNTVGGTLYAGRINAPPPNGTGVIGYYWSLSGLFGSPFSAVLTFQYTDADLTTAGLNEGLLELRRSADGGQTWTSVAAVVDSAANTIRTADPVTGFSLWTIGARLVPAELSSFALE